MQSIMDRRFGDDMEYENIKACQREARKSGMFSVIIGSGVTYITLKLTRAFKNQPKYIPLVCFGVGVCCGYVKSVLVVQKYRNQQKQLKQKKEMDHSISGAHPLQENLNENKTSQSKYGDENFFMDEKDSK